MALLAYNALDQHAIQIHNMMNDFHPINIQMNCFANDSKAKRMVRIEKNKITNLKGCDAPASASSRRAAAAPPLQERARGEGGELAWPGLVKFA